MEQSISALIDEYIAHALPQIITDRRTLHRHPEVAEREVWTQEYLWNRLQSLKPDRLERIADTGIRCVFYGADTDHAIGFRADMDALNVSEATGLEYCSEIDGFMHACGHDGHMATLLALAGFCAGHRDLLERSAVLFFQPAEEADGGAERIIAAGGLERPRVDEIYGMHVFPGLQSGQIACPDGPLMAAVYDSDIVITGTAAHGAMPHMGRDALAAAVALYGLLQTVVSRQTSAFDPKVLTVGALHAGERRNVVADRAVLECTLRTYDDAVEAECLRLIQAHMSAIETAYGVKCELIPRSHYLSVINDGYAAGRVRKAAGDMTVPHPPITISEDFSFYQRHTKGAFFFCGIAQGERYSRSLHSSDFDLDERSLLNGLRVFIRLLFL